jgi:hypothetical protein
LKIINLEETGLCVVDGGLEAQKRTHVHRFVEADVADVTQLGPELAVQVAARPRNFQRLTHQETAKYFVVQIPVLEDDLRIS